MKRGRPTKYKKEYAEEIIKWFNLHPYKQSLKKETIHPNGKIVREYTTVPEKLPFISSFARSINVDRRTIQRWAGDKYPQDYKDKKLAGQHKHPEFCRAYNIAKDLQREFLVINGLMGHYPPASYIFTAKNITNMSDKQHIDHTSNNETIRPKIISSIKPYSSKGE